MSFGFDPAEERRPVAAHLTVAALALAGAVGVQINWLAVIEAGGNSVWRPAMAAAIVATTAWLISTAWLHRRVAHQLGGARQALLEAGADVAVVILAAMVLRRGHVSGAALTDLWLVPPILLAIGATSAVVLAIAGLTASNQTRGGAMRRDLWRIAIVVGLIVSLGLLTVGG